MFRSSHRMIVALLAVVAGCSRTPASSEDAALAVNTAVPQLKSTYWKLVTLGDTRVSAGDGQREAHIILSATSNQASGSGGCNRMFATYTLNGDALTFGAVGATKMACPGAMETENAFLPALGRVTRWRISGQQLELLDAAGAVVARFDAKAA
jgi:copper homeostasis protein (lipoprotein)